jgi:glucosyl-3-phosphoglycerate synthase
MDLKQDKITTLHDFNVEYKTILNTVKESVSERPVSIVMPMLHREITGDALAGIKNGLNKCDYLQEIVIPLAAQNEREFNHVKSFFFQI